MIKISIYINTGTRHLKRQTREELQHLTHSASPARCPSVLSAAPHLGDKTKEIGEGSRRLDLKHVRNLETFWNPWS